MTDEATTGMHTTAMLTEQLCAAAHVPVHGVRMVQAAIVIQTLMRKAVNSEALETALAGVLGSEPDDAKSLLPAAIRVAVERNRLRSQVTRKVAQIVAENPHMMCGFDDSGVSLDAGCATMWWAVPERRNENAPIPPSLATSGDRGGLINELPATNAVGTVPNQNNFGETPPACRMWLPTSKGERLSPATARVPQQTRAIWHFSCNSTGFHAARSFDRLYPSSGDAARARRRTVGLSLRPSGIQENLKTCLSTYVVVNREE